MMILLSKKEYNDLCQRATNADAQAEIKLEELKKKLAEQMLDLLRRHFGDSYSLSSTPQRAFIHDVAELLKRY